MYGYKDSNELQNSSGNFGLNTGAVISKFEYNANAGKDGAVQDAIDLAVKVGDWEYTTRFFPVTKVFNKTGQEIMDVTTEEYKTALAKDVELLNATLSDIVKCFVSAEDLRVALTTPIASFRDYAIILQGLVQATPNWAQKSVDVFLQYQWSPYGENTKTFPELPKSVKHGIFLCATEGTGFEEERTGTHIKYVNAEGKYHIFKRSKWFVTHAFANQIDLNPAPDANAGGAGEAAPPSNW